MEIAKRNGGGGARTMRIQPSRFGWTSFRNDLHFYAALGLIPLGSIVLYSNLFIGKRSETVILVACIVFLAPATEQFAIRYCNTRTLSIAE